MLQRIYGTAFSTKEQLDEYLWRVEEARKRDHRKLGPELDLFSISEELGPGLILWHPKGARVRVLIEDFWRKSHFDAGYDVVFSPHVARATLWETSGHAGFYSEYMYPSMDIEDQRYIVKPMNCPFHIQIYKSKLRSYRELPLRWAELGTVYRFERSGVLHGLLRVRGFTQDDAHIFCRPDQVEDEVIAALDLALKSSRRLASTNTTSISPRGRRSRSASQPTGIRPRRPFARQSRNRVSNTTWTRVEEPSTSRR